LCQGSIDWLSFHCPADQTKESKENEAHRHNDDETNPVRLHTVPVGEIFELRGKVSGHDGHWHEQDRHFSEKDGDACEALHRLRFFRC